MKVETRKIYRSGKSSYIITLPKDWVDKLGIKEGEVLFLEIHDDSICIKPKDGERRLRAVIDDETSSFDHLVRLIISYYLGGYDPIFVKVHSDEQRRAVAYAMDLLIGAEIMEDTGREVVVEIFLDLNRFEIYSIIERLFNIVLSMLKDFEAVLENKSGEICSSIMVRESEVDKLHFLALRLLNHMGEKGDISTMDATNYRSVVRTVERISDHISYMSEAMLNVEATHLKISSEVDTARKILSRAMVAFFKKDRWLAEEVLEDANDFANRILKFYEDILNLDVVTIMNMKTILDSLVRVTSYSADIAEIAINMSVLTFEV